MRANIATERPGKTRIWEAAGTASGISLPQLASALGLTEPVQGMVRAIEVYFPWRSTRFPQCHGFNLDGIDRLQLARAQRRRHHAGRKLLRTHRPVTAALY